MTGRSIRDIFPAEARPLIEGNGLQIVERLGIDSLRELVADVMCGVNIRSVTEALTRTRIGMLNAALITTYVRARLLDPEFPANIPQLVKAQYRGSGVSSEDQAILRWMLGLTGKQVQNVLRSDDREWDDYGQLFTQDMEDLAIAASEAYGEMSGGIELGSGEKVEIDWPLILYLAGAIGSQTLSTRGSEKSTNGKFFEKLVLGGVLHLLGLRLVSTDDVSSDRVFWLSSRGDKRESDATALLEKGVGVRFDIGFIGPGNTEISLDKASRFEREIEIGGESRFMHTFIIVDRIGARSRIIEQARDIGGTILQMSASFWPRELGDKLAEVVDGYESPLAGVSDREMRSAIEAGIANAPFEVILEIEEALEESSD